ncbi:MAG: hypothetical protein PF447_07540 [Spirochaetaceae bacterium]|jgi:hypothetical protein|nr:hypothetical protein [Spirochaetaceae bacterium]
MTTRFFTFFIATLNLFIFSSGAFAIDADLGIDYGTTQYEGNLSHAVGLTLNFPLESKAPNWGYSVGYSLVFSEDHFNCSAPAVFGTILFLANAGDNDDLDEEDPIATLAFLCIILPENFTIHYRINPQLNLGLSLHPWGADFDFAKNQAYFSSGASLAVNYIMDSKLVISPFLRFRYLIVPQEPLINGGLRVGYNF